ncbi:MAG: DUF1269 domain-containing protein, partial [Planctomycetales bacterium]|nr:DUF1269 domain-containing protein [Planctomycetales bacterium]
LLLPGVGPVALAGAMASAATGGVVGGLVGAMSAWGVRDDAWSQWEDALKAGQTLIAVQGQPLSLVEVRHTLENQGGAVTCHYPYPDHELEESAAVSE